MDDKDYDKDYQDSILAAKAKLIASIRAAKDANDATLALTQVRVDTNPDINLMKYRLKSGYYNNSAVVNEKALYAYTEALEIQRNLFNVVLDYFFNGHELDENKVDAMLSRIYSLNEEDAEYNNDINNINKIRKNQREEDAFANSGNDSQSVIGRTTYFAKGAGGRRTRRYKKHSNKKRSGHKRLHKKRMSRRR
jgi:hypothetical protein